jgi:outer membrane receptor protein involved in Fe transport
MKNHFIIVIVLFLCHNLSAGTSGKLAGKVTDEEGNIIVFANLQIAELQIGAQSDENGNYFLRNIPPGNYDVSCSQISHQTHQIKDVKIVSDETTMLNIVLTKSAQEIEGVYVSEAKIKMVDRLKTSSGNTISEATIENVAVTDIEGLIAIQAGAIVNDGKLHFRGGKVNEVVYMIDGIAVNDMVDGEAALTIDVDAIKEMKVMTGGFPAEFGNAQSGVINIITKDGGDFFSGKIELSSDHITKAKNQNSDRFKFVLSGPIFTNKLTFFINAGGHWHDSEFKYHYGINANNEIPELDSYWQDIEFYDPYKNRKKILGFEAGNKLYNLYNYNIKLKYSFSPISKIAFIVRGKENDIQPYEQSWRYALEHFKRTKMSQRQYMLSYDQIICSDKFLNFRAGIYQKEFYEKPRGLGFDDYFAKNDSDDIFLGCLSLGTCDGIDYLAEDGYFGDPDAQQYWRYYIPQSETYKNINEFLIPGTVYSENVENKNSIYTFKADFDWQISHNHNVKTGLEIMSHDIDRYRYIRPWDIDVYRYYYYLENYGTPRDSIQHLVTGEYMYYYDQEDIYQATLLASGETYGLKANPWQIGWYLQDKFEKEGLVVNAGIRFDTWYLGEKYRILNDMNGYENVEIPNKSRLHLMVSPRLGISHAISENDVLHFSYNYQMQLPQMQYVYANATWIDAVCGQDLLTNVLLGNPNLEPQITIASEVGIQHQFNEHYVTDLTVYYKKSYNYVSVNKYVHPLDPMTYYYQYISKNYGTAKGMDINLQKTLSSFIVGSMAYSLGWAEGTDARVLDYMNQDTKTLREFPLDWDIRHSIGINITFEIQKDEEFYFPFTNFKFPADDLTLNLFYNFASGAPYTDSGAADYETNNKRKPYNDVMHLKFTKNFSFFSSRKVTLYCSINNLFNKKNIEFAYLKTGSPYEDGADLSDPETGYIYEETQQIHNIFTKDPGNVSFGRELIIGLAYSW